MLRREVITDSFEFISMITDDHPKYNYSNCLSKRDSHMSIHFFVLIKQKHETHFSFQNQISCSFLTFTNANHVNHDYHLSSFCVTLYLSYQSTGYKRRISYNKANKWLWKDFENNLINLKAWKCFIKIYVYPITKLICD